MHLVCAGCCIVMLQISSSSPSMEQHAWPCLLGGTSLQSCGCNLGVFLPDASLSMFCAGCCGLLIR